MNTLVNTMVRHRAWLIIAVAIALLLVGGALFVKPTRSSDGIDHLNDNALESVQKRTSLEDYSWSELATIAYGISICESETDAFALAHSFCLCAPDGSLSSEQMKTFELANGVQARVTIAGIWHDQKPNGGKTGLTFAFTDAAIEHTMNHSFEDKRGRNADSTGGWAASDMRAWLNGELLYDLPADLRERIMPVQKRTANTTNSTDELDEAEHITGAAGDWVSETTDRLWLFSVAELCGNVRENADMGVDDTIAGIYAAEGAQYRAFADAGITAFKPNAALVRTSSDSMEPATWWLRSKTLEFGDGFWLVGTDGTPLNGLGEDARVVQDLSYSPSQLWGPDHARGVVAGFCL